MKEYEYSFKVKSIDPYIKYCEENGYTKEEETTQNRILYRNVNKTMARITAKTKNGKTKTVLDFKDDNQADVVLKVSRETIPLEVTPENEKAVDSILDMLEYTKDKTLIRTRMVYKKGNVTFEIDKYDAPEVMFVVAIEGEKEEVDKTYAIIKEKINNEIEED